MDGWIICVQLLHVRVDPAAPRRADEAMSPPPSHQERGRATLLCRAAEVLH